MAILPSFKRRPSTTSSAAQGYEGSSPSLRASGDGEAGPSSGRRRVDSTSSWVMATFNRLNEQLPENPRPVPASSGSDAKLDRGIRTLVSLSKRNLADVVEPLVYRLRELVQASEFQTQDLSLSRTLQSEVLLLDILSAVIPKPPSHPGELPPSVSLPLDDETLHLLLEVLSKVTLERVTPITTQRDRNSEDSGRGSIGGRTGSKRHQQPHHLQRHQNTSSRSGPFSPNSSSNSLPQDTHTFASGGSSLRNGEGSSDWPSRSGASAGGSTGTASGLDAAAKERARKLIRAISYFRWDVVWPSIRERLQHASSESLDESGLSETCLEACFVDRTRILQVLNELGPLFLHLPRATQLTMAEALYQAIWTWIRYSPADFIEIHQSGQRLHEDLASLFDVCYSIVADVSALGGKGVHSLWSLMTLLLALSPELIRKVLEADPTKPIPPGSSLGKKITFVEGLTSAISSTRFANAAKRCCLDVVELGNLLPSDIKHQQLLHWVSDVAGDLQDQLLNGKDAPDAEVIARGLALFHRREPASLLRAVPRLESGGPFERMCLARACTVLVASDRPVDLDTVSTISSSLGSFILELKSSSRTAMDSTNPANALRDLRQSEIEVVHAILELYSTDVRYLVELSGTDRLGMVLNLLSCMVCDPMPESLRSAAADMFRSVVQQTRIADTEGSPLSVEVLELLSSTSWRTAGNAAHQVLDDTYEHPCGVQDLAVLVKTLSLACELASDHSNALAASQAIREGLAMHEIALTFALLSSEDEVVTAAADAFVRRDEDLTRLVASFAGEASSSAQLDLIDAQQGWRADTLQLFPSGRADAAIDSTVLNHVLSARPAATRSHAYVFKKLYGRWDDLVGSVRSGSIPPQLPQFTDWLHLGTVLSRLGQSCFSIYEQREKQYHPNPDTAHLIQQFIQGLCECLVQQQPALRSIVEGLLSEFGPGLIESLIPCLVKTGRNTFRKYQTPILQDPGTAFVSHALNVLVATMPALTTPICADPGPLLSSLVQRLDRNASTLAGVPDPFSIVDGVPTAVSALQRACELCKIIIEKRDLFEWSGLPLLRCELLDRLSNWTTFNLSLDASRMPTLFHQLDEACISAIMTLTEGLKLQAGWRSGGSRKRLFESSFSLLHHHLLTSLKAKAKAFAVTLPGSIDLTTTIRTALSHLLNDNGDVAFDRCVAMTYSKDLAVRAVYIKVVSEATRKLVVKEKRSRADLDRFPLLDILVEPSMPLLPILSDVYARADHDTFSELVLRRFENEGAGFQLLKALAEIEVSQTTNEAEIFRGATLCTKVYSQFARLHANSGATRTDLPQNPAAIEILAQTLLDRMCASLSQVPYHLRAACRILGETVSTRFPGLSRRAIGSFVVLRIISPTVISPGWIDIDLDGLSSSGRRALVDVSKLITNLANDVVLGQKESHMNEFHAFRSRENIHAMEHFLDGLAAPDTSTSTPLLGTPSSADEDDSDELFLRFMLQEHAEAADRCLERHPRRDEVRKLLGPPANQAETAKEFRARTRAKRIHVEQFEDIFREVTSEGKTVFCLDCGRLGGVDLDRLLRYALDLMQDALVAGFSVVLDCSSVLLLEGLPIPWLLETLKTLDTIKTIWEGGAARCWNVVVYNPNSLGLRLYQRLSSLLALTNGTRALKELTGASSLGDLAKAVDVDPDDLAFLGTVPMEEDATFFDYSAEYIDSQRNRVSTSITLGTDAITLSRPRSRAVQESLKGASVVHDTRPLSDLRDMTTSEETGTRILRLRFKTGDPLELITEGVSELEMMIPAMLSVPAPRSRAAAPEMTAVRLTLSALLNLTATKTDVRSAAFDLLTLLSTSSALRFPSPLPSATGLAHPRAAQSAVLKLANDITILNPEYSIALIREGCLAFGLVQDTFQQRLLLDFFHTWVWNLSGLVGSVPPKTDHAKLSVVLRDLLAITIAHHKHLRSELSEIWSKIATFDTLMADAAAHEVIAKAMFAEPGSERLEVVAEVMLSIASHSATGTYLSTVLKVVEGSPRALREHAWRKQLASLAVVTEKLSHVPRHLEIFVPELLHVSLLSLWAVSDSHTPPIHKAILNVLRALATPSANFEEAIADLVASFELDRVRRTRRPRSGLSTAEEIVEEAVSKERVASCTLSAMLHSAKNRDQPNIWRTRWLALATTSALKSSVAIRPASLAILKVLVVECETEASGLYCHILDSFARTLTDHSDDEAGVVGMIRFLTSVVDQLSTVSLCAAFWVGIAVVDISPVHFAVGLDLIDGVLKALLKQRCYPTSNELVAVLVPPGNFFLSTVDEDWGVNLEESFVFSVLAILFKGLHSPSTSALTTSVLLNLLSLLLQSRSLDPAEELALVHALLSAPTSSSPSTLSRIETLYSSLGLPSTSWEHLPIDPNNDLTLLLVAFVAGPVLSSPEAAGRTEALQLLAGAAEEAPKSVEACRDVLMPQLSRALAEEDNETLLGAADAVLAQLMRAPMPPLKGRSATRDVYQELEARGLSSLLSCHLSHHPHKIEHFRRLLVVASEVVRVEVCRLEMDGSGEGEF